LGFGETMPSSSESNKFENPAASAPQHTITPRTGAYANLHTISANHMSAQRQRSVSAASAQRQRSVSAASAQRQRSVSAASAQRQRSVSALERFAFD
jgi:hypothetical protein